jgi:hypothetical protein
MFALRSYSKAELAMLYAPHSTPSTAVKNLYRWINQCEPLKQELQKLHYNHQRRTFLRQEVEAIIRHLGEP